MAELNLARSAREPNEPLDFISKLAALVPRPRVNLTRFHGVFAPNSKYRAYMGICFEYYGITRNAGMGDLWLMILAFTGATTALGLLFGVLFPRSSRIGYGCCFCFCCIRPVHG
jgi:hypothetical protein